MICGKIRILTLPDEKPNSKVGPHDQATSGMVDGMAPGPDRGKGAPEAVPQVLHEDDHIRTPSKRATSAPAARRGDADHPKPVQPPVIHKTRKCTRQVRSLSPMRQDTEMGGAWAEGRPCRHRLRRQWPRLQANVEHSAFPAKSSQRCIAGGGLLVVEEVDVRMPNCLSSRLADRLQPPCGLSLPGLRSSPRRSGSSRSCRRPARG